MPEQGIEPASTTHLLGPPVGVGDRVIQRCAICGEKLFDTAEYRWPPGSPPPRPWPTNVYMRVCDGVWRLLDPREVRGLPEDLCLSLVEAAPCPPNT